MASIPTSDRDVVDAARRWARVRRGSWVAPAGLIVLVIAGLVWLWISHPAERWIGEFMAWSQPSRVELGRGWDLNREGAEALETLSDLAQTTRQRREAGNRLTALTDIPTLLDTFQVFSITPDQFLRLYGEVPVAFQDVILDPIELLRARSSGNVRRVFLVKEGIDNNIYLVGADNVALARGELADSTVSRLRQLDTPVAGSLEDIFGYPVVIDAAAFFAILRPDGPAELERADLAWISSLEGQLSRVGIGARPVDRLWPLAIEVRRGGRTQVHRYWLRSSDGRSLLHALQDRVPVRGMEL